LKAINLINAPILLRQLDTKQTRITPLLLLQKVGYLVVFIAAGLVSLPAPAHAEPPSVSVILSENSGAYSEFANALRENLLNSNVTLNILDTTQAPPNSRLIIAVGMKAAVIVARSDAPNVLNVMIPKSGHKKLLQDFPKLENSPHYSSIFLDQPVERQLRLIASAFPGKKRIGLLFDSPLPDEVSQLRQQVADYGFSLYEQDIAKSTLFDSLQKALQHSDVLLALPIPTVYNSATLRNILVSTYQAGIPLVGFSSSYVKAGALCAVFSTPAQFASQTSSISLKFIETGTLPQAQYPKLYEVAVNDRVAQSMNINIKSPEDLSKRMSTITRQMP
jgi:putative tryptophan/tyrosine transport system substrate-binding protein